MIALYMDMPENCSECPFYDDKFDRCIAGSIGIPNKCIIDDSTKSSWCPILYSIDVDTKTDWDKLYQDIKKYAETKGE